MNTDEEEKEKIIREKVLLLTGGGEEIKPEDMEDLYIYVQSWSTEEEDNIHFTSWKGVDEYQDPVDPTLLSANFAAVFPEVESLIS